MAAYVAQIVICKSVDKIMFTYFELMNFAILVAEQHMLVVCESVT
jgi:hypothetical protein